MELSNRSKEFLKFADEVVNHIEEYTIPQYGDAPNDQAAGWSEDFCVQNIKKYCNRWDGNARGDNDRKLSLLKIAHYACIAFYKEDAGTEELKRDDIITWLEKLRVSDLLNVKRRIDAMLESRVDPNEECFGYPSGTVLRPSVHYTCSKCGYTGLPRIEGSGHHTKFFCSNCLAYIKFARRDEVDAVTNYMIESTQAVFEHNNQGDK